MDTSFNKQDGAVFYRCILATGKLVAENILKCLRNYLVDYATLRNTLENLGFLIPQRYVFGVMGFLALVASFQMRLVLSVAITEMVLPNIRTDNLPSSDTCPDLNFSNGSHMTAVKSEYFYNWSETIQGLILGSFYWGYVPTQVPGGNLAEKYGGKYVLGLGILSSSICTILIPVVVKAGDWPWLIALRIISGLGEGGTFPALNVLLAKWTPLSERASLGTLVYAGAQIGTVLGTAGGGFIISATQTWEYAFYIIGGLGIIWFILWVLLCYSDPQSHPYISNNEKAYLQKELSSVAKNTQETPWKTILTSTPVWAVVLIFVGHSWGLLIMISHLPKYMSTILKFDVKESGIWSSCPHLAMWIVSMLSAPLCDWLIVKEYMSITTARKFFSTIAMVGPGAFILAAGYAGCDQVTTVILFTAGMAFMGPYSCGMMVNVLDLSRNFSGSLMALANAISALTGIAGPYLAGALTEDQTLSQWKTVFWITFGIFLITNLVFIVYGSGETQWWDVVIVEPEDCSCSIEENTLNKPNTSNVI